MLYTEDFTMRHYVGFSQIGSQIVSQSFVLIVQSLNFIDHKATTNDLRQQ